MIAIKEGIWHGNTMAIKSLLPYPYTFIYSQAYIKIGNTMAKVKRICKQCGKEFETYLSKTKGKFCSRKCSTDFNKKVRIERVCPFCGKTFGVKQYIIDTGKGIFCSHKCFNEHRKKQRISRICKKCGKSFSVPICKIKQGYGVFCSKVCQTQWFTKDGETKERLRKMGRTQKSPTTPERIFEGICKNNNLPFKYTGDRSLWLGNANPDFIHNTRKLVCEVFGDFWHSPLLNRTMRYTATLDGRRAQLKTEGYKLIVLWETDLKRKDAEAFVLNTLKKEGVKW